MTAQATLQSDSKQSPACARDISPARRIAAPRAFGSLEIDTLRKKWQSAADRQHARPPFEELALDSPGGLGENVALLEGHESGNPTIVTAGRVFEDWIGREADCLKVDELAIDRARALRELHDKAVNEARPVQTVAYGIVDGLVCVYDLVAVPLSNRRGLSPCLVYIQERQRNFSLVEAIFQATNEGLLALAVIRDAAGTPCDFQIAALNDGAAQVMQGTMEGLRGRRISEACAEIRASEIVPRIISVFNQCGSTQFELQCPLNNQKYLRVGVETMGDLVTVTLTDISGLKAQEKSFRLLFESNPVPMWLHCPENLKFLAVNGAAVAHYGFSEEAFLGMSLLDIVPKDHRDAAEAAIRNNPHLKEGTGQLWRNIKADGSRIDVLTSWREVLFHGRPAQLVAVMDVTEKRQAEKRVSYMARHDGLTGLPNRALFNERLDEALLRVRRDREKLAVHYMDLDHFKDVNDTLGHPAGDKLLVAVADRLRSCLREGDIVARFGGDEFAILQMALAGAHEASALAERIEKVMSEPYEIDGQQIMTGASAGIALAPADGDRSDELLKKADMALYRAKEVGRRTFRFFEPSMDASLRARQRLEGDLRNALIAGEFELFYQPLVSLKTGAISGFEALLRWRNPRRGFVSPAEFIPLAEETGLIVPLGEWVLRQACAEAAKWPDDLKVAVNLSPVQFKKGNLPQVVLATLAQAGLAAARLELEITESVLLEESKTNLATLRHLRALGVGISMDDFGTGYSSLSYLRSFPFDKIKIDRSFVAELGETGECLAIVGAIAKLALNLGIPTTAEGVETEAQRELLRKEGCTEMQGYLFSRPIPASEIAALLSAHPISSKTKEHLLSA